MSRPLKARNPRTGEQDYEFNAASSEQIQTASAQLRQGNCDWQSRGLDHRIEVLRRWKAAIAAHRPAILNALTTDTGRYLLSALEVDTIALAIDRWCKLAPVLMQAQSGQSVP